MTKEELRNLKDLDHHLGNFLSDLLTIDGRGDHQAECTCDELCRASTKLLEARISIYTTIKEHSNARA